MICDTSGEKSRPFTSAERKGDVAEVARRILSTCRRDLEACAGVAVGDERAKVDEAAGQVSDILLQFPPPPAA